MILPACVQAAWRADLPIIVSSNVSTFSARNEELAKGTDQAEIDVKELPERAGVVPRTIDVTGANSRAERER
jgi:hypothetical protein